MEFGLQGFGLWFRTDSKLTFWDEAALAILSMLRHDFLKFVD